MNPKLTLIAALSEDGYISRGTGVPWKLPVDVAHFRSYTAGKWLLLGRRTYEEMLGWFQSHHTPLVLSRDPAFTPPIGQRVASVTEALEKTTAAGAPELVVIGGSAAFDLAMPLADRLVLTQVQDRLGSGVPFPPIAAAEWRETSSEYHPADAAHPHAFRIVVLERVASQAAV